MPRPTNELNPASDKPVEPKASFDPKVYELLSADEKEVADKFKKCETEGEAVTLGKKLLELHQTNLVKDGKNDLLKVDTIVRSTIAYTLNLVVDIPFVPESTETSIFGVAVNKLCDMHEQAIAAYVEEHKIDPKAPMTPEEKENFKDAYRDEFAEGVPGPAAVKEKITDYMLDMVM